MSRPLSKNAVLAVALATSALAIAVVAACATGSRARGRGEGSPPRAIWLVREAIHDARLDELSWPDWAEHRDAVEHMYVERGFTPAWVRKGRPTKSAQVVIAALERSEDHGLTPGDYDAGRWVARVKSVRDADVTDLDRARFDLALTVCVMRYVSDLHRGRVHPRRLGWRLPLGNDTDPSHNLARVVDELSTASDADALLASVEPPHPQYRRLMRTLHSYRKLARTEEMSSTSLERRVRQIELELERWRSMPGRPERRAIVVNLPEFRLRAFDESGQLAFTSAVVVGESRRHPTPLFTELMSTVVFRPGWYVPSSITRGEIVPKLEKDPAHLSSEGYEILGSEGRELTTETLDELRRGTLRLRQKPGAGNALGPVKFLFPNRWNVYLHGTPQTAGFTRVRRDLSHGCVRVADPIGLAQWVLRDEPDWSRDRILEAIAGDRDEVAVTLDAPIPVHLVYSTVTVTDEGDVLFFDDLYGHDARLERALARRHQRRARPVST